MVKKGTTGDLYAADKLKAATVYVLDKEGSCVLEVAQGKADAFIYDQMSTLKNWERNQEKTRPLLRAFQQEKWAIGIRKGNDQLRTERERLSQGIPRARRLPAARRPLAGRGKEGLCGEGHPVCVLSWVGHSGCRRPANR